MQHDVDTVATSLPIRILGVNEAGEDRDNAAMCQGRTLPWLQDVPGVNAWQSWQVTMRDVVVLDGENRIINVYNLTANDLADSTNYGVLRGILLDAAR